MRGPTLPFAPTKTYDPIFIDIKENRRKKKKISSISILALPFLPKSPPFDFYLFISDFFFTMCLSLIRVRFCPEEIYLFSIQFILNELRSSHFLTSEIFVKISSLESLATYHLETRKKVLIVSEFDEIFLGY